MIVRQACTADGPELVRLFAATPLSAGTDFILDRAPDFFALLRARGQFRTFVAVKDGRLAGSATALWHDTSSAGGPVRVGEIVDLRVADWARRGRGVASLLGAVSETLQSAGADWAVCLIADRNRAAASLVRGAAGLPQLDVLDRWASVHYLTMCVPGAVAPRGTRVREADAGDAPVLAQLAAGSTETWHLAPPQLFPWPDPAGQHRGWIAEDSSGRAIGGLVVWDAIALRRVRIARYAIGDLPLRMAMAAAASVGAAVPLPAPGGVLTMWAARWIGVVTGAQWALRALIRAAHAAAVRADVNVVQINLSERDPQLGGLPFLPRSTFRSTLFGVRMNQRAAPGDSRNPYFADLARV